VNNNDKPFEPSRCSSCGAETCFDDQTCPKCGVNVREPTIKPSWARTAQNVITSLFLLAIYLRLLPTFIGNGLGKLACDGLDRILYQPNGQLLSQCHFHTIEIGWLIIVISFIVVGLILKRLKRGGKETSAPETLGLNQYADLRTKGPRPSIQLEAFKPGRNDTLPWARTVLATLCVSPFVAYFLYSFISGKVYPGSFLGFVAFIGLLSLLFIVGIWILLLLDALRLLKKK
jgi:hypothetical protein